MELTICAPPTRIVQKARSATLEKLTKTPNAVSVQKGKEACTIAMASTYI